MSQSCLQIVFRLSPVQHLVSEFKCGADMILEQCHTHQNGSVACPQTCEDLDPEQERDCERYAPIACQPLTHLNESFTWPSRCQLCPSDCSLVTQLLSNLGGRWSVCCSFISWVVRWFVRAFNGSFVRSFVGDRGSSVNSFVLVWGGGGSFFRSFVCPSF